MAGLVLFASQVCVAYTHFEARHTHPLALTPDGRHLLALNSTDARLSVFLVGNETNPKPILVAEIPVGLEPVSIAVRSNDEVWVVNELSDSISVVSLDARATVANIYTPDEPADIAFIDGKAFISCARSNMIRVIDAETHLELAEIPLAGVLPRSLLADPVHGFVYAAFLQSGNNTTILPADDAPAQPAPTNPELPAPPKVGLLLPDSDERIAYDVLDHDIAVIDVAALTVDHYLENVGTNIFDMTLDENGALWASNTEAHNLLRFQPTVRGVFASNRVTHIDTSTSVPTPYDLNPWMDGPEATEAQKNIALAQPDSLLSYPGALWVAAFGSDRLAKLGLDGKVQSIVNLRPLGEDSSQMRGPRGLAYQPSTERLFVYNKLSNTLTTIDASTEAVLSEVPVGSYDPMPQTIADGRGFLFDARLSGNGTVSCATCHIDADRDGVAWDLGEPDGEMTTVLGADLSIHDPTLYPRSIHPMKGPMMTQTLRGISGAAPFHWRGDKPDLESFNANFDILMGGETIPEAQNEALAAYMESIGLHPNPNQNLDRSLKTDLNGANAVNGEGLFLPHLHHCAICHIPPTGTDNNIDIPSLVGLKQNMKNPTLRDVYQKVYFTPEAATTISGYGLGHDGSRYELPRGHPYLLDSLTEDDLPDLTAYVLSFDTGTAPTVGYQCVVSDGVVTASALDDISLLESQAAAANCDLIVRGTWEGRSRGFLYSPDTQLYQSDKSAEAFTRTQLLETMQLDDHLTFLGVLPGQGGRYSLDRNEDSVMDGDDVQPQGIIQADMSASRMLLKKPAAAIDWYWESRTDLEMKEPWNPLLSPKEESGDTTVQSDGMPEDVKFYRLQRTW